MAEQNVVEWAQRAALSLRQPARSFAGSVRATTVICAILVGGYNFIMGSFHISEYWRFRYGLDGLVLTTGVMAITSGLGDVAMILAIVMKKDQYLHSILCAALAVYFMCPIMSIGIIIGINCFARIPNWAFQFWEVPRIAVIPLYVCLLYCLLVEVRGGPAPGEGSPGSLQGRLESPEHCALLHEEAAFPSALAPGSCIAMAGAPRAPAPAPALAPGPLSPAQA